MTVDFPAEAAAEAFATRFDGVYHLSRPAWPDSPSRLPAQERPFGVGDNVRRKRTVVMIISLRVVTW
jgi:hypothetical protein